MIMGPPVIRIEGLHRTYSTGSTAVHALRGVELEVQRGEMVAIMGASGSGKSTLMNILGCLDRPTKGAYWLDGVRVDGLNRDELADLRNKKLGFVFQSFNLLPRTSALENVELPLLYARGGDGGDGAAHDPRRAAEAALTRVGLGARGNAHPSQLSGGQQQRVAIARALVTQPALLLADEPTGNLDTHTSLDVMALFQELNDAGVTLLIVTHEPDIARYAKRIIEMRDGLKRRDEPVRDRHRASDDLANLAPDEETEGVA